MTEMMQTWPTAPDTYTTNSMFIKVCPGPKLTEAWLKEHRFIKRASHGYWDFPYFEEVEKEVIAQGGKK